MEPLGDQEPTLLERHLQPGHEIRLRDRALLRVGLQPAGGGQAVHTTAQLALAPDVVVGLNYRVAHAAGVHPHLYLAVQRWAGQDLGNHLGDSVVVRAAPALQAEDAVDGLRQELDYGEHGEVRPLSEIYPGHVPHRPPPKSGTRSSRKARSMSCWLKSWLDSSTKAS